MPFTHRDSFSIDWAADSAPAKQYVHVAGGANVSVTGGALRFGGAGVLDRAANGADFAYTDGYSQIKLLTHAADQVLRLFVRSDGTNYAEATVNLTSHAWTLGTQAGTAGSGELGEADLHNDTFRLEIAGSTLTLKRQIASAGAFVTVATQAVSPAASGRAGVGVAGAGVCTLKHFECGPLTPHVPLTAGPPQGQRLVAFMSQADTNEADNQAGMQDGDWADPDGQIDSRMRGLAARGYQRVMEWSNGLNDTGIHVGVGSDGVALATSNLLGPRHHDILLATARSGFATAPADGRVLDNWRTVRAPLVKLFREYMLFITPPPQGLDGQTAWPATDAAFAEYLAECIELGIVPFFDTPGGVNVGHASSSVCAAFADFCRRRFRAWGVEPISPRETGYGTWWTPPCITGSKMIGPPPYATSSYDLSGVSFWERAVRTEPGQWHGPQRSPRTVEWFATIQGDVPVADRERLCLEVIKMGHTPIVETFQFSAQTDRRLQNAASDTPTRRHTRRGRAKTGAAARLRR